MDSGSLGWNAAEGGSVPGVQWEAAAGAGGLVISVEHSVGWWSENWVLWGMSWACGGRVDIMEGCRVVRGRRTGALLGRGSGMGRDDWGFLESVKWL